MDHILEHGEEPMPDPGAASASASHDQPIDVDEDDEDAAAVRALTDGGDVEAKQDVLKHRARQLSRREEWARSVRGVRCNKGSDYMRGSIAENTAQTFCSVRAVKSSSSLASRTRTKTLAYDTILANARFFGNDVSKVPRMALTVGVAAVLEAREVVVVVTGLRKSLALSKAIELGGLATNACVILTFFFLPFWSVSVRFKEEVVNHLVCPDARLITVDTVSASTPSLGINRGPGWLLATWLNGMVEMPTRGASWPHGRVRKMVRRRADLGDWKS
ncbi:hypothetical protein BU15DRAFT_64886 [Melanogaster broomeanus]|nr:hypothetical protein BU15DRAFT_64886 [Melanogaster broomeanus]